MPANPTPEEMITRIDVLIPMMALDDELTLEDQLLVIDALRTKRRQYEVQIVVRDRKKPRKPRNIRKWT